MSNIADLFGPSSEPVPPTSKDGWMHLEIAISDRFSPHAPIDEDSLFAGRVGLINRLVEVVFQAGQHAILYGERGVGKTSLANILRDKVFTKASTITFFKRSCTKSHDFRMIWQHVFDSWKVDDEPVVSMLHRSSNPFDVYKIVDAVCSTTRPVIIIDEFDRVVSEETKIAMADTIKYLSDYGSRATVIIVGVARSVSDLLFGHESIGRCLEQVPMPRMHEEELAEIITNRLPSLGMVMDQSVLRAIVSLSQGFPGYTHLLGQAAARSAAARESMRIATQDLSGAMAVALEKSDETIKELYSKAVRSTKPKNQYKEALLACAMASPDERGYFSAASVREPFSVVMGRKMEIPNFARHLNEFCDASRGPVLIREGKPKTYEYKFVEPLLRPFVMIRGLKEKLIHDSESI